MVYESDFYTTRRPYRSTPGYSSYTVSKREIPWEKVPFVPRPSLVPDPVTAFGKKKTYEEVFKPERKNILSPAEKAKIKPKELIDPPKPYLSSPRHYLVRDSPDRSRRGAEEVYSYSYSSNVETSRSDDPYSRPTSRSYATSETVNRSSASGPGSYSYSSERTSRSSGDGPGGYRSSYSSTTSGRLPGGTSYRHYSYRV